MNEVVLWRLFFNLLASTEPARPELSLEALLAIKLVCLGTAFRVKSG